MQQYEYKVVPAPRRGEKARGVKRTEDRFARTLAEAINDLAAEGWEYQRAETLPCEERTGLTGRITNGFQSVLIFRRRLAPPAAAAAPAPAAEAAPQPVLRAAPAPVPPAPPQRPASEGFVPAAARAEPGALPRLVPMPTVPPVSAPPLGPATGRAPAPNRGDQAAE